MYPVPEYARAVTAPSLTVQQKIAAYLFLPIGLVAFVASLPMSWGGYDDVGTWSWATRSCDWDIDYSGRIMVVLAQVFICFTLICALITLTNDEDKYVLSPRVEQLHVLGLFAAIAFTGAGTIAAVATSAVAW
jgi:uncharacterized membrane protein